MLADSPYLLLDTPGVMPMPAEFIDEDNSTITNAFKAYAGPLVGPLPACERISAPVVEKILNK